MYLLVINQAIYIPHLDHHLLCPMQCQVDDVTVDNKPKLVCSPTDHTHALTLVHPDHPAQTVILQLALQGVTSLLNVRAPTLDKRNSDAFTCLYLTSESLTWELSMTLYEDQEAAMTNYSGNVVVKRATVRETSAI